MRSASPRPCGRPRSTRGSDRKSTRLNSSHANISYAVFCLKKTTKKVHETPLLIVPQWINKYYILDMQPKNSMVRYLVEQGFTVFVISLKNPDASMEEMGIEDYMDLGLF